MSAVQTYLGKQGGHFHGNCLSLPSWDSRSARQFVCVCVRLLVCVCVCVHITFEAGHVIKEEMEYVNEYGTEMKSVCCVWLG